MFCPEDYTPLYDIMKRIRAIIFKIYAEENSCDTLGFNPLILYTRKTLKCEYSDKDVSYMESFIYDTYILNAFIMNNTANFYVATTNGNALRLSSAVFTSLSPRFFPEHQVSPHPYAEEGVFIMEDGLVKGWLGRRLVLPFVNWRCFCLDARSAQERELQFTITPKYCEDRNSTSYKYWSKDLTLIQKSLRELDNSPICFKCSIGDIDIQFIKNFLFTAYTPDDEIVLRSTSSGRPAKLPETIAIIRQFYPSGNYPGSKVLTREICQSEYDVHPSERTVKRAVREIRGQNTD